MIRNKLDNKVYIGQTIKADVNERWRQHKRCMNTHGCPVLYSAFRKYGLDNFEFKIICICFDESCDALEEYYITKYNSISPNGYNLEKGGNKNKIVHPDTCERISKALTGKKHSEERRLINSNAQKGKKWTEEAKQKMSISRRGRKMNLSEEQRQRLRERLKGHPTSDKTRQSVAEANKNRIWTNEMKQKMSTTFREKKINYKSVGKFSLDNTLLESYSSIKDASEKNKVSRSYITDRCNGKLRKQEDIIFKFI
jgi:group I intron endonuclease